MALRLIEMVAQEKDSEKILELIKEQNVIEHRQVRLSEGEIMVRILLDAEKSETVLDLLEKEFAVGEGNRIVILPVAATMPRVELAVEQSSEEKKTPERIAREELYEDIKDAARCSRVFVIMTILSIIVATFGLYQNSEVILIGAMVISPSLGPSMGMALGTILGDLTLLRRALLTGLVWTVLTIALSLMVGLFADINPELSGVASRATVSLGNVAVALASGCAGALAFTTAVSSALIGVMVAVALLPPLVTFGVLLGSGNSALALGALTLFLVNLICVNLAGVTTFLIQGIHPLNWWEKNRAKKATIIAVILSAVMFVVLVILILLVQKERL